MKTMTTTTIRAVVMTRDDDDTDDDNDDDDDDDNDDDMILRGGNVDDTRRNDSARGAEESFRRDFPFERIQLCDRSLLPGRAGAWVSRACTHSPRRRRIAKQRTAVGNNIAYRR